MVGRNRRIWNAYLKYWPFAKSLKTSPRIKPDQWNIHPNNLSLVSIFDFSDLYLEDAA